MIKSSSGSDGGGKMMVKKIIFLYINILLALFPLVCFSENQSVTQAPSNPSNNIKPIVCDPPQGMRVDYFVNNKANLQNEQFIMGRDQVSGMKPQIILNNNKTVSFIIGDATEISSLPKSGNMQVLLYNDDQISFASSLYY